MDYSEVKILLNPVMPSREVLLYHLGEIGYDSFTEEENGLNAYVPTSDFSEEKLKKVLSELNEVDLSYTFEHIKTQNWNEIWESNFQPIIVNDKCIVRATFHEADQKYEYDIIINPQMSFGTGHHETTFLVMSEMLKMNFADKYVLDMGSGTGILAILASKLRANKCLAIDIEEWAFHNAIENNELNQIQNIEVKHGDVKLIQEIKNHFDIVLANINRNVLMADVENYITSLKENGELLLSGFYTTDASMLVEKVISLGMELVNQLEKNTWCMLHFKNK